MDKSKKQINEEIAEVLGFEKYIVKMNGKPRTTAWKFPKEWRHLKSSNPTYYVPDFLTLIKDMSEIYSTILPMDHSTTEGKFDDNFNEVVEEIRNK